MNTKIALLIAGLYCPSASASSEPVLWSLDSRGAAQASMPSVPPVCDNGIGTPPIEQVSLIALFEQFRQGNNEEASLKQVAAHAQTKDITVAGLAGVLLTFNPAVMNRILTHYTISVYEEEIWLESLKSFKNVLEFAPLENSAPLKHILKEYIVDAPPVNYLDAYKALKEAQESIPLSDTAAIQVALEEYIVDERPIVESKDNPTQKCEAHTA